MRMPEALRQVPTNPHIHIVEDGSGSRAQEVPLPRPGPWVGGTQVVKARTGLFLARSGREQTDWTVAATGRIVCYPKKCARL